MPFDALATVAPAELPSALVSASTTSGRPLLVAGGQPRPAVVLLDFVAQSVTALPVSLLDEAAAVVAAMTTEPDADRQTAINRMVADLVYAGVWEKLSVLYVFAAHDNQAALLNWIDPAGTVALEVNSPTFTTDRGYTGDGVSAYIDTQQVWSTLAGTSQNDVHVGGYFRWTGSTNGGLGTAGSANVGVSRSAGNMLSRLNNATVVTADAVPGSAGTHLALSRSLAASFDRYIDGAAVSAGVQTSSAPPASNLCGLRANTAYATSVCSIRALHAGVALTAAEIFALRNALQTYMATIGAS